MIALWPLTVGLCFVGDPPAAPVEIPKATDDRLVVELVAQEPEIVTPTGVAVDERGRIWVIENQTHHRPADYKGPAGDASASTTTSARTAVRGE